MQTILIFLFISNDGELLSQMLWWVLTPEVAQGLNAWCEPQVCHCVTLGKSLHVQNGHNVDSLKIEKEE